MEAKWSVCIFKWLLLTFFFFNLELKMCCLIFYQSKKRIISNNNIYFCTPIFLLVLFWEQVSINVWAFKRIFYQQMWLVILFRLPVKKYSRLFLDFGRVAVIWLKKHWKIYVPEKYDLLTYRVIILTQGALEHP